jgi:hypothetical protein
VGGRENRLVLFLPFYVIRNDSESVGQKYETQEASIERSYRSILDFTMQNKNIAKKYKMH